jgi:hypothetical protein
MDASAPRKSPGDPPEVVHGAYVKTPRGTGDALKDVMFDSYERSPENTPDWQRGLRDRIHDLCAEVMNSDLNDDRKLFYISGFSFIFSNACVNLPATSKEPTVAGQFRKYLEQIADLLRTERDEHLFAQSQQHLRYYLPGLAILSAVGIPCVEGYVPAAVEPGNYMLAAAAALAGLIVSDWLPKPVQGFEESARRKRELKHPFGRMVVTVFLTVAICLAVASGAIDIKLGQWSTSKLGSMTPVALFIGFLAGIPTSFLVRRFIGWVFNNGSTHPSDGQRPTAAQDGTPAHSRSPGRSKSSGQGGS